MKTLTGPGARVRYNASRCTRPEPAFHVPIAARSCLVKLHGEHFQRPFLLYLSDLPSYSSSLSFSWLIVFFKFHKEKWRWERTTLICLVDVFRYVLFFFLFFEGRGKYYRGLSLSPLIPLSQLSREQRERERESEESWKKSERKKERNVENRYGEIKCSIAGRRAGNFVEIPTSRDRKKSADNWPHNGPWWTRRKNSVKKSFA